MEQKRPLIGVGVAVSYDGKILLGKRKGSHASGVWGFPGGHLEFGESAETCAIRELFEETGLKALSCKMGPWVENVMEGDKHYVTLFVFVDRFEGDVRLMEPHKCEGWEWFDWKELPTPLFSPILSLLKKSSPPGFST